MLRSPDRLVPTDISCVGRSSAALAKSTQTDSDMLLKFVGVRDEEGEYEGHSSVGIRDDKHQV